MIAGLESLLTLEGRTALVTGGSRGIGRGICVSLARAGAFVVVNYASNEDAARETLDIVERNRGRGMLLGFEVQDSDAVNEAIAGVIEQRERIDILVNNAGITRDGLLGRMRDTDWNQVIEINLSGAFHVSRAVSRGMIRQRSGRIVNVASTAGEAGNAGQANYSAAKAGLIGLTKALARELAPRNILVNAVSPGIIDEGITRHLDDRQVETITSQIPLRRMGTTEEVCNVALFLCSPLASYMTGQVVRVNGGLYV